MTNYTHLSREDLETRLAAAERVCAMFGWCAARSESDADKAAYVLWMRWLDAGGNPDRKAWHDLSAQATAELARIADERRRLTLAGQGGVRGENLPR